VVVTRNAGAGDTAIPQGNKGRHSMEIESKVWI
jgi:hypothetical protein